MGSKKSKKSKKSKIAGFEEVKINSLSDYNEFLDKLKRMRIKELDKTTASAMDQWYAALEKVDQEVDKLLGAEILKKTKASLMEQWDAAVLKSEQEIDELLTEMHEYLDKDQSI